LASAHHCAQPTPKTTTRSRQTPTKLKFTDESGNSYQPLDEMGERVINLALREPRGSRSRIEQITGKAVLRASTAAPSAGTPK
jgi:hypothetical protein